VYCNAGIYPDKIQSYNNARLIYMPINASGFKGIIYDIITYIHALIKSDIILYLSPVGSGFITPLKKIFRKKVIINHGGLNEWERDKLSPLKQRWAKFNHRVASKFADINIVDNYIYKQSLKDNFNANSIIIKYGGDHVSNETVENKEFSEKYNFVNSKYAVSVSRAQIDNNLHLVLQAFETFNKFKLVLISNWNVSAYGKALWEKYQNNTNIILLDAIYNQQELNYIRGNAWIYIHTHSRCGTAPSLIEAMCLNLPVISFDVKPNRETTANNAIYFDSPESLFHTLESLTEKNLNENRANMIALAKQEFQWSKISDEYAQLFDDL
ncbi:MAG: glycosyltransferase, partial [Mariniphaga sp.]|nr:glycosyltransferase [Mariniphaga sp.]